MRLENIARRAFGLGGGGAAMNDLVSEYQQYQDATAEDEEEMDEEEME